MTMFRWRAGEISRIEGFSDAVFAFALTLLVVSLEVPRSFDELMNTMSGFVNHVAAEPQPEPTAHPHQVMIVGRSDDSTAPAAIAGPPRGTRS